MFLTKQHLAMARTLAVALVATLGLASCATYDDEFAGINSRLDHSHKVQGAARVPNRHQFRAAANQRLDQIESRVQHSSGAAARAARLVALHNSRRTA